ncbi:MAG TPA: diguanylate cyclase [Rhodocyclaceae bacterium]|nr:diguanylate cyclase [Rhodocyclaceae bacterium]
MFCSSLELSKKSDSLRVAWMGYRSAPRFEHFVEFAVTLSSFADFLNSNGLSGLCQLARELEQQALALFGDETTHPVSAEQLTELEARIDALHLRVGGILEAKTQPIEDRRSTPVAALATPAAAPALKGKMVPAEATVVEVSSGRCIWFIGNRLDPWRDLLNQLVFFGIHIEAYEWGTAPEQAEEPTMMLLDLDGLSDDEAMRNIKSLRSRFSVSNLIGLNVDAGFSPLHAALSAGCDSCFVRGTQQPVIMARIIELNRTDKEDPYRVLVVEDSMTATALIQRTLKGSGVESYAIAQPLQVLEALQRYRPDLILMDMYMPGCTGVEAARVIRQYPEFLSTPIVYLSGETDVARQIDALRLGGDHFLTKPFNPVILNAVVKTKIERYRALRRLMSNDSLTGLLNHTSSKQRLELLVSRARVANEPIAVAMIDIDHFKKVNDTYGHPVGDQIIRSLAWLLKQRLRASDVVGRYGGEEFLVGLPGVDAEKSFQILDRIRRDFGQIKHASKDTWFSTTFSSGVAHFPVFSSSEALIKAADEALYEAKRGGRDRVVVHS